MSIILPQQAIPLRNPYSVLFEQESDHFSTTDNQTEHNNNREILSDDGLDQISVHSWSVIASTVGSDNEQEDEDEDENEVILDDKRIEEALTVSSLGDGFTDISKTVTATSINSASLAGRSKSWAIKVSKKQRSPRPEGSTSTTKTVHYDDNEDYEDNYGEEMGLDDRYMSMTEHELSKSAKAVKLKNIRLATAADKELFRVLNVPDRKALPTRANVTDRSKTRGRSIDTD
ncbi:hypothetical protein BGZ83_011573 [Gryganskiella cystojenkinii]|nr:hypothetical protein BGZ83_011573 [Gryganskiella cystojenkinii]